MPDPILDEEMILEHLKGDVCVEATSQLQSVALYTLVAAYDRKVVREEYTPVMDAAMGLHSAMGKLFMLNSIREHFTQGTLNLELLDRALTKATSYAAGNQTTLVEFMEQLVQCPTSKDKVH